MSLFRNVVFAAALSGLLAGLVLAALQSFATVPLILQAEAFESAGPPAHDHGGGEAVAPHDHGSATPHEHGQGGWAPADGLERLAWSAAFNVVSGIGFALILMAASELAGGISGWRQGIVWGLAGFAVFSLAPNLGLPPELPAMPSADLASRQAWWLATVAATAAGLALIAFRRGGAWPLAGLALIVAPHLFGAPQPASHESPVPTDLHRQFVIAVSLTSLVFWVVLGAMAGAVRQRFLGPSGDAARSLA